VKSNSEDTQSKTGADFGAENRNRFSMSFFHSKLKLSGAEPLKTNTAKQVDGDAIAAAFLLTL